jgi:hypothetical protein
MTAPAKAVRQDFGRDDGYIVWSVRLRIETTASFRAGATREY